MNKYICIHGHFYQPPRENPWLNEVELQDSAYPYHDWNERITAECYARNAASRILSGDGRITSIVNNYEYISFNFGPTLLQWMEKEAPETYRAILEADKKSQERFSGHGSALAQAYNHIILPLANARDRETQVLWGIRDFEARFQRRPEGMWLPETAATTETLETLASAGIRFTILSPYQAARYRKKGERNWKEAGGGRIDPRRPYRCHLPSGRYIDLFFYEGTVSQGIAFEGLLNSGEAFAGRLLEQLDFDSKEPQLMHIATDGETYGHHHLLGEMALSYCLRHIERQQPARLSIYAEYLEMFPPQWEVEIIESSSWSCAHGVERWRSNCGCSTGGKADWNQEWRAPLREALDWLRDQLIEVYESQMAPYTSSPWDARNEYIQLILDRSEENVNAFLGKLTEKELEEEDKVKILKLLEMQYHSMLMYTSCGWFFDEVSGIETMQDLFYAARALQLCRELSGRELEEEFVQRLEKAKSNLPEPLNAASAYRKTVQPAILDLTRVAAHYAVSSLFTRYPEVLPLFSFTAISNELDYFEAGRQKLVMGRVILKSQISWEKDQLSFAILHLGDHHLFGGVRKFGNKANYNAMREQIKEAFDKSNVFDVMMLMDQHFGSHSYSFWHLFKDVQKQVLHQVLERNTQDIERQFSRMFEQNYPLIQAMQQLEQTLPRALRTTVDFVINVRFRQLLEDPRTDIRDLRKLVQDLKGPMGNGLELDRLNLNFIASRRIKRLMQELQKQPRDLELLAYTIETIQLLKEAGLQPDLWQAQNLGYRIRQVLLPNLTAAKPAPSGTQNISGAYKELFDILNIQA